MTKKKAAPKTNPLLKPELDTEMVLSNLNTIVTRLNSLTIRMSNLETQMNSQATNWGDLSTWTKDLSSQLSAQARDVQSLLCGAKKSCEESECSPCHNN